MRAPASRQAMIDEALRQAPQWAQQHLLEVLLDPSQPPCARCEAAVEAIRAVYRALADAASRSSEAERSDAGKSG